MKKKFIILLILLCATPVWANDLSLVMGKAIASISTICGKAKTALASWGGGGVPAASGPLCTVDDDSAIETIVTSDGATAGLDTQGTARWRAQQVILPANSTVTQIIFKAKDTNAAGNLVVSLFTDNSGVPGSEVSGTSVSIGNAAIGGAPEIVTATLSSPVDMGAGTTFWVVYRSDAAGSSFSVYADSSTPDNTVLFAQDLSYPSSWSTATDRDLYTVIMGCSE